MTAVRVVKSTLVVDLGKYPLSSEGNSGNNNNSPESSFKRKRPQLPAEDMGFYPFSLTGRLLFEVAGAKL